MAGSKVTFRIQRFHPSVDREPRDQDFEIELPSGITILKALNKIRESSIAKVDVIGKMTDPIILNTLAEDSSTSYEEAVQKIYARLRPGNPVQLEKAKKLFH